MPSSVRKASIALYRSLLRVAVRLPDEHRRALVCFRAREEFERSRIAGMGPGEAEARLLDGEIYLENLQHQAAHLLSLSAEPDKLLIPIDLRASPASSSSHPALQHAQSTSPPYPPPTTTSSLHSPAPPGSRTEQRRKLITAIQHARTKRRSGIGAGVGVGKGQTSRFMQGPEPSWIVRGGKEAEV